MRAGSSAVCGVVLAMVAVTGCAPFLSGEAGAASPGGVYSAEARAVVADGVYGDGTHPAETTSPAVEGPAVPAPALPVPAVAAPALAVEQEPGVFVVRTNRCCPGPVIVTVACADTSGTRDVAEAPPPAPYKPWPGQARAPSLYHDR